MNSIIKTTLETKLHSCGWQKQGNVWQLDKFRIPQKTVDKLSSQPTIVDASHKLAEVLEFGAKATAVATTIRSLKEVRDVLHV